MYSQNTVMLA